MKITTVLEGFWLEKRRQFSGRTVENYTRIFTQLIEHLGDVEFEGVTTIDIRRHLDYLERERGLARRSVYAAGVGLSLCGICGATRYHGQLQMSIGRMNRSRNMSR